jgi:DNA-binding SARP family transcriptional activator
MYEFALRLLGPPEVYAEQRPVTFPTRRALALLIYVALERRVHRRDSLQTIFWPDSDVEQARTSLRTTLAYIRKALPQSPLIADRDSVAFDPYRPIDLDVQSIHAAAQLAYRARLDRPATIASLRDAARTVRGDFLDGFSIPGALGFDDWCTLQREAYHRDTVQVFDTLSCLQLEANDLEDGLATVTQWLVLDPTDETAYQRKMQIQLALGEPRAAGKTAARCAAILKRELDVEPSNRTKRLSQQAKAAADPASSGFDAGAECVRLNRVATTTAQSTYDLEAALDLLRPALHLATQSKNALLLAETEWNLAQTYYYMHNLGPSLHHGTRAIALARSVGRDDLLGRALNVVGYARMLSGHPLDQVVVLADEAVALFQKRGKRDLEADCLALKATAYILAGYPRQTLEWANQARAIAEAIEDDWGFSAAAWTSSLALVDLGQVAEAVDVARAGLARARVAGHPPMILFNLHALAVAYRASGDVAAARELHHPMLNSGNPLQYELFGIITETTLCADDAAEKRWADACRHARQAQAYRQRLPLSGFVRHLEIEALLQGGSPDAALAEITAMRREIEQRPDDRRLRLTLERSLGVLARWQGDRADTAAHVAEAARLAGEYEMIGEQRRLASELAVLAVGD